jgi:hypothetical protein
MASFLEFSAGLAQSEARQYLGMYKALFGGAPDPAAYASTAASLQAGGGAGAYIGTIMPTALAASGGALATSVLANVGITPASLGGATPAASFAALQGALEIFFTAFPQDRAQVIFNLVRILPNLQGDAVYGTAASAFSAGVNADFVRLDAVPPAMPDYVYPMY